MKITFLKSDAAHDEFPDEPDELMIEVPGAQITYEELRETDQGETIAFLQSGGFWTDIGTKQHWSDIVFDG